MSLANAVLNAAQKDAGATAVAGWNSARAVGITPGGGDIVSQLVLPGNVVNLAYYGDSRANVVSTNVANAFDVSAVVVTAPTGSVSGFTASARAMITHIHPGIAIVANCGISGDTVAGMIARESAGASATRKSLDDAVSRNTQILVFRVGINTITSAVTGAFSSAVADAIWLDIKRLLQRAVSKGLFVVDEGNWAWEHTDTATYPPVRAQGIRDTVKYLNEKAIAFAKSSGGSIVYHDVWSLCANPDGTWKSYSLCSDSGGSLTPPANTQLVHASATLSLTMCEGLARIINTYFGVAHPAYVRSYLGLGEGNMITNPDLMASASGLGTGWATTCTGTGAVKTNEIVERKGKLYQTCKGVFSGAGANIVQVDAPVSQMVGAGATKPIVAGGKYSIEFDWFIDDGFGGDPLLGPVSGANFFMRFRVFTAAGNLFFDPFVSLAGDWGLTSARFGKAVFPPITFSGLESANFTDAQLRFVASRVDGNTQRIGMSSPRLIRIA